MNDQIIYELNKLQPNSEGILRILILINNINTLNDKKGIYKNITKYFSYLKTELIKSIFKNDAEMNDNFIISFNETKKELISLLDGTINQNIKIIESENFKVAFEKPNNLILIKDEVSIIIKGASAFRPLSDEQMISYCSAQLKLYKSFNNIELDLLPDQNVLKSDDFEEYLGEYFYVYLTKSNYEDYIKNGSFRLGSILKYHKPENENSKDLFEGFSNLFYNDINLMSIAGLNYYIFCGTEISEKNESCEYMKKNYGDIILKVNIHGFAKEVQKIIGAKSYCVKQVKYSTLKVCRFYNKNELLLVGEELFLEEALYDLIKKEAFLPSLFLKPLNYKKENEIRLVFEMNKNVCTDIYFTETKLKKWIEVINIKEP